jgi:hypothetical protein
MDFFKITKRAVLLWQDGRSHCCARCAWLFPTKSDHKNFDGMRSHSDESPPGTNSCHAVREMRTGWELALFCESCMIELPIISILIRASSRTKERGNVYNDLLPEGEGGPHSVTCYCRVVRGGAAAMWALVGWPREQFVLASPVCSPLVKDGQGIILPLVFL